MNTERPDNPDTPDRDDEDAAAGTAGRTAPEKETTEEQGNGEARGNGEEQGNGEAQGNAEKQVSAEEGDAVRAGAGGRRRSSVVVSVAVAVLLAGGGGAYLAATAGGGSGGGPGPASGAGGTPPRLALDGYAAPSAGSPAPSGGTNGIAPGEPAPYGVTYKASGALPDGPGSAPVYRPAGEVTAEDVARLAVALGVDGKPVTDTAGWRVGSGQDGAGPSLRVAGQAPGNWTFQRYAPGTDNCKGTTTCTQGPADPAAEPVSVPAAEQAAAPVLKALGQDDAKIDASRVVGAQRVVNADPVVGGRPTYGWTTGLTVSGQGDVVAGSGLLKAPEKGDTYPVLSARRTLDLMNAAPRTDHRMGIGGCAGPVPLKDRLEQPCEAEPPTAAPRQGTATVRAAVFGLAAHSVRGRQTLVPSWLFEVRGTGARDAFTVTYPAVDPEYLGAASPSAAPPAESGPAPKTRDVTVDGYTAEDSKLTVSFMGGVCADYTASVEESAKRVTVTVTEKPWPDKVCILIAKEYRKTVALDAPLGGRSVVGTDGKPIPEGGRGPLPRP
ncbi:hypothetical protein [Streptomyces sp. NPDC004629]|uniref:hypothetical protein n=1 Tax=Streptomyces sp. NPDC004629 TaxID=3364705 RepID=UPI0036A5915B